MLKDHLICMLKDHSWAYLLSKISAKIDQYSVTHNLVLIDKRSVSSSYMVPASCLTATSYLDP